MRISWPPGCLDRPPDTSLIGLSAGSSPAALLLRSGCPAPHSQPPPVHAPSSLTPLCAIHSHAGCARHMARCPGLYLRFPRAGRHPRDMSGSYPCSLGVWVLYPRGRSVWVLYPRGRSVWVLYPRGQSVWVLYPVTGVSEAPVPVCCRAQLSSPRPFKTESLQEPRGRVLAGSGLEPWGLTSFPGEPGCVPCHPVVLTICTRTLGTWPPACWASGDMGTVLGAHTSPVRRCLLLLRRRVWLPCPRASAGSPAPELSTVCLHILGGLVPLPVSAPAHLGWPVYSFIQIDQARYRHLRLP